MEAGPHEACQGLGSPRCAGVHSVRNVSAGPVQPSDCRRPRFHMMEPDAAIRILFFTRHCSRAASPPYPSTVVDFRKAQDRLAKPVQAGSPDSRRASVPVWQNAPILSHHPPVHARYKHSRCSLTHMNPCPPPPLPRHEACHPAVGTALFLSPAGTFPCFRRRERWRKSCKRHRIISEKKRVFLRALWAWSTEFIARSGDIRERSTVSQIPVPARCSKVPASASFFGGMPRMMTAARRPTAVHREPASGVFSTSQQGKFHDEDINGSRYRQCPA